MKNPQTTTPKPIPPKPSTQETVPSTQADGEYDPIAERSTEHGQSTFQTFCNLLKILIGTGVLALPRSFNNAGYIPAVLMILLTAAITSYCLTLLVKAQVELCKKRKTPVLSFPETFKYACETGPRYFSWMTPIAKGMVRAFIAVFQTGVLIVYCLFSAENIQQVVTQYHGEKYPLIYFTSALLIPLLFLISIKNLSDISIASLFANLVIYIGLAIIIGYIIYDMAKKDDINYSSRKFVQSPLKYPLFFGTVCFAFSASAVIIPVSSQMKKPKGFYGVFGAWNLAVLICGLTYSTFGVIGYSRFGEEAEPVVIMNLPYNLLTTFIRIFYAVAIYLSYAINAYPVIDILYDELLAPRISKDRNRWIAEYAVRYGLVLFSFGIAAAIPKIGSLISLCGALCVPMITFVIPAWVDFLVHYPGPGVWRAVQTIIFTLFGLYAAVYGSVLAIKEMIETYHSK